MADNVYGFDDSKSKVLIHGNSITAQTTFVGSATKIPKFKFDEHGHLTEVGTVTVYPPTEVGTAGQVWTSDGSGPGAWKSLDHKQDRITISTSEPSGGKNGDIWLVYE